MTGRAGATDRAVEPSEAAESVSRDHAVTTAGDRHSEEAFLVGTHRHRRERGLVRIRRFRGWRGRALRPDKGLTELGEGGGCGVTHRHWRRRGRVRCPWMLGWRDRDGLSMLVSVDGFGLCRIS